MTADLRFYSNTATPVEIYSLSLPTTSEGSVSAATSIYAKNVGDATATSCNVCNWTSHKYTNTAGTPIVSVATIIRDATTKALQVEGIVDETLTNVSPYQVYTANYAGWYSGGTVTVKKNSVVITSGFTLNYALGTITFSTPNLVSDVIKVSYTRKLPTIGTYNLTFPTTATCKINGGSSISIVVDGSTPNTNVISGCSIVFSAGLTTGDTATITISDDIMYIELAPDVTGSPGTWTTQGLNLGSITSGNSVLFWIRLNITSSAGTTGNTRYAKLFLEGTSA